MEWKAEGQGLRFGSSLGGVHAASCDEELYAAPYRQHKSASDLELAPESKSSRQECRQKHMSTVVVRHLKAKATTPVAHVERALSVALGGRLHRHV